MNLFSMTIIRQVFGFPYYLLASSIAILFWILFSQFDQILFFSPIGTVGSQKLDSTKEYFSLDYYTDSINYGVIFMRPYKVTLMDIIEGEN